MKNINILNKEIIILNLICYLNWVRWEKTCRKTGEPSSKAKYYKFSDSEKVL
jgi:hypothetical protein